MSLSVCQNLLNFIDLTVEKLVFLFEQQKSLTIELNDKIASLDRNNLTYWDCFEYSMEQEAKYSLDFALSDFEQLHPSPEIRAKSSELNKALSSFAIEQSMRQDVYDVISHYYHNQYVVESNNLDSE